MQVGLHVKYPLLLLSGFNEPWIFLTNFRKLSSIKFHESPSDGSRVVLRGRTDVTKLIVAIHSCANASKDLCSCRCMLLEPERSHRDLLWDLCVLQDRRDSYITNTMYLSLSWSSSDVQEIPAFYGSSSPRSHDPATSFYPEPDHSILRPSPQPIYLWHHFIFSYHLYLGLPNYIFPSSFPTQTSLD